MPADGAIQFAFDRYLLPSTVSRQSIVLADASNPPSAISGDLAPIVTYDPIARTVTLAPPKEPWLTEGATYRVFFTVPNGDDDSLGGLRAIDRAALGPGEKIEWAFNVGPAKGVAIDPPVSFCRDVLPIFTAKCSSPTCHGSADQSAASLLLTTSAGVGATAIGRVAQGANRGPSSAIVSSSQGKFGIDMPIIDPGRPGNSWLLYKVELARPPIDLPPSKYVCQAALGQTSAPAFNPLARAAQRAASDAEHEVLSNYILGHEMPYPLANATAYETVSLTFDEREKVRVWISSLTSGQVPECGGCGSQ